MEITAMFDKEKTLATQAGNFTSAAGEYLEAISFMMDQLRHQRRSGDSGIFG